MESGRIEIAGKAVRVRSPREAVAEGVALIPEDRQKTGLATALPIGHNLTIADLGKVSRMGLFLDAAKERRIATEQIERLRIRCASARQLAGRLSGGNRQKGRDLQVAGAGRARISVR